MVTISLLVCISDTDDTRTCIGAMQKNNAGNKLKQYGQKNVPIVIVFRDCVLRHK